MPRNATQCHAVPRSATRCHAVPHCSATLQCHATPDHTISYPLLIHVTESSSARQYDTIRCKPSHYPRI